MTVTANVVGVSWSFWYMLRLIIYILILANYTVFSVQDNLHAHRWGPFYQGRTHALGTCTPSRWFLRKWTIQQSADSKSVSARNECNYVVYTAHLAVLSLRTHGQVHQARPLLAVAQLRGFGKDLKCGAGCSAADWSRALVGPPRLTTTDVPSGFNTLTYHPVLTYYPVLTYHDFWFRTTQMRKGFASLAPILYVVPSNLFCL